MKRAIIVDDEQAAIKKLEKMLIDTGTIDVCGAFSDPTAVTDFLKENVVDIAFLDIEMPKINGIELADQIMDIQDSINIIFVTAFSEYAVEAFRCHALDYLLKPVNKDRLEMTIKRISDIPVATHHLSHLVKVNCFGRLTVTIDEKALKFRTAKAEELFAYLIDNNGQPMHRNYIMDAFWCDYDGDRALVLFNTTLHYLKKAFNQFGVKLNVIHQRGTYSLDMADMECDAVSFCHQVGKLKNVTDDNVEECEKVLGLYIGNYLEQNDYEWTLQKRMTIKDQYAQLLLRLAEYYLNKKYEQKALNLITNGLKFAPVDKNLNLLLLKILKMKNDEAALQSYFQLYKDRLYDEFGLEPDSIFDKYNK